MPVKNSLEYKFIADFYGSQKAKRSQVHLINHIDEGLKILDAIGASEEAMRAYCIHPLFQNSHDLQQNFQLASQIDPYVMMLAMEYRNIANSYLSFKEISHIDQIKLSPLTEVNQMLVADKIQNFKDFMLYHHGTHQRSDQLYQYFKNWFEKLGIPGDIFKDLAQKKPFSIQHSNIKPSL